MGKQDKIMISKLQRLRALFVAFHILSPVVAIPTPPGLAPAAYYYGSTTIDYDLADFDEFAVDPTVTDYGNYGHAVAAVQNSQPVDAGIDYKLGGGNAGGAGSLYLDPGFDGVVDTVGTGMDWLSTPGYTGEVSEEGNDNPRFDETNGNYERFDENASPDENTSTIDTISLQTTVTSSGTGTRDAEMDQVGSSSSASKPNKSDTISETGNTAEGSANQTQKEITNHNGSKGNGENEANINDSLGESNKTPLNTGLDDLPNTGTNTAHTKQSKNDPANGSLDESSSTSDTGGKPVKNDSVISSNASKDSFDKSSSSERGSSSNESDKSRISNESSVSMSKDANSSDGSVSSDNDSSQSSESPESASKSIISQESVSESDSNSTQDSDKAISLEDSTSSGEVSYNIEFESGSVNSEVSETGENSDDSGQSGLTDDSINSGDSGDTSSEPDSASSGLRSKDSRSSSSATDTTDSKESSGSGSIESSGDSFESGTESSKTASFDSGSPSVNSEDNSVEQCFRDDDDDDSDHDLCGLIRSVKLICTVHFPKECFLSGKGSPFSKENSKESYKSNDVEGPFGSDILADSNSNTVSKSGSMSVESLELDSLSASFESMSTLSQLMNFIQDMCPDICAISERVAKENNDVDSEDSDDDDDLIDDDMDDDDDSEEDGTLKDYDKEDSDDDDYDDNDTNVETDDKSNNDRSFDHVSNSASIRNWNSNSLDDSKSSEPGSSLSADTNDTASEQSNGSDTSEGDSSSNVSVDNESSPDETRSQGNNSSMESPDLTSTNSAGVSDEENV